MRKANEQHKEIETLWIEEAVYAVAKGIRPAASVQMASRHKASAAQAFREAKRLFGTSGGNRSVRVAFEQFGPGGSQTDMVVYHDEIVRDVLAFATKLRAQEPSIAHWIMGKCYGFGDKQIKEFIKTQAKRLPERPAQLAKTDLVTRIADLGVCMLQNETERVEAADCDDWDRYRKLQLAQAEMEAEMASLLAAHAAERRGGAAPMPA